jgi:hypothetical protein
MTTQALTFPQFAPAVQDDRVWTCIRRVLTASLLVVGLALTIFILIKLGPVAYGLPVPLMRRGSQPLPKAA